MQQSTQQQASQFTASADFAPPKRYRNPFGSKSRRIYPTPVHHEVASCDYH